MEIWVSPKIKVLPCLRKFVVNSGLGKFRHGKSIALSTKLVVVVVDGRACWRHLYDIRGVVAVYYKSINCNPLTSSLRFVVDLLYNLFLYSWQDFDWHSASRGPSALAELLVYELVSHLNLTRRIVIHSGDMWKCYDTIRDAILTCARKPTWVSLSYRTKPKCKNRKKTKSRKQICPEITVHSPGNPCSKYLSRKKGRATVG